MALALAIAIFRLNQVHLSTTNKKEVLFLHGINEIGFMLIYVDLPRIRVRSISNLHSCVAPYTNLWLIE